MSKKWSSEKTIKFLLAYEQHPCLWDVNSDSYKHRDAKVNAYQSMARTMGIENFGMFDVKAKIRSIRNVYTMELAKIAKSKKSGAEELYKPKLQWFVLADRILHQVVQIKEWLDNDREDYESKPTFTTKTNNHQSTISDEVLNLPTATVLPSIPITNNISKKRTKTAKRKVEIKTEVILKEIREISEKLVKTRQGDDQFDCFGKLIACHLKRLPELESLESMSFIHSFLIQKRLKVIQNQKNTNFPTEENRCNSPLSVESSYENTSSSTNSFINGRQSIKIPTFLKVEEVSTDEHAFTPELASSLNDEDPFEH